MIGENWAYFDQIDFENPYIIAIPMKVVGCDGSPVRAIAVEWGGLMMDKKNYFRIYT